MRDEIKEEFFLGILAIWLTLAIGSLSEAYLGKEASTLTGLIIMVGSGLSVIWALRKKT